MKRELLLNLFRIVTLIQGKPGIKVHEIAESCEISTRSVYRYLDILSGLHIPVTSSGYGQGYRFIGTFAMFPLDWTEEEKLAFSLLPMVHAHVPSLLPASFKSSMEKMMAVYRMKDAQREEDSEDFSSIIRMATPLYHESTQPYLIPLMQAAVLRLTVEVAYHTQSRDELSQRKIDPYYLVPRKQRFYLIGYCHTAKEVRTFRVSRFRHVNITTRAFEKNGFKVQQFLEHTWSIHRGDACIFFRVKFSPAVARYIKEEEFYISPKLTDLPDGGLLFEVTLNHDREFLAWLYQYGAEAELLEPVAYRQHMRELLYDWQKVYEEG